MIRSTKAFITSAALVAGLASVPALAQTHGQAAPPVSVQPSAPAIQPSDAQLQKFVQASEKVSGVADEYRPKVNASPDEASRQKVIQEADEKMARLVTEDGLTVDEFVAINDAIQQDPQLRDRVIKIANNVAK